MHDESERDRKRGDGDFRNRRIAEPPLVIHTQLPEDEKREEEEGLQGSGLKNGIVGGGSGSDGADSDDNNHLDESAGDRGNGTGLGGEDGAKEEREVWALAEEEVGTVVHRWCPCRCRFHVVLLSPMVTRRTVVLENQHLQTGRNTTIDRRRKPTWERDFSVPRLLLRSSLRCVHVFRSHTCVSL